MQEYLLESQKDEKRCKFAVLPICSLHRVEKHCILPITGNYATLSDLSNSFWIWALRKQSTLLDKVLFVADKIAWDQQGTPPYIQEILQGLQKSITHATFAYIHYLWRQRDKLKVVHPWLKDAYEELAPLAQ